MADRFSELCAKWHTPKVPIDGNPLAHNYGVVYNALFEGLNVSKMVEIGIGYAGLFHQDYVAGGSLKLWEELFPGAMIFGIDNRVDALVNQGRIFSFCCDQGNEEKMRKVVASIGLDIDLVVDDGSHEPEHQVLAAKLFVPRLSKHGVMVIEDVRDGETSRLLPMEHTVVECEGLPGVSDDRLIVINAGAK